MAEDLEITGATAGSPRYIVAYLDVNTNNLYDSNGNLYGNSTLATTLGNEFILELHYVQDISTSDNPDNWTAWEGLSGMTVSSTLAFDDNYVHAVEATVAENTNAGSPTVKVNVPEISKDVLSSSGNLVFNPFGIEPEDVSPNDTRPVKQIVPYSSFNYISGTVFEFTIEDAQGLPLNVVGGENATPVRVSDPLYLFVGTDSIYENNIPDRYGEGVFKFPMYINSRKLLKALDYSGASGVSGTMEHNIYVKRSTIAGIKVGSYGATCVRDSSQDTVAVDSSDNKPYLFCCWTGTADDETVYTWWTKGNEINESSYVYDVYEQNNTKIATSLHGDDDISQIVYNTDSVLFRTFAFPFIVKNLVDYGNSLTIPVENTDWTKEYIISIVQNNSEILVGKASAGNYGTVLIGSNIDVNNGIISVKDASTEDKGLIEIATSAEVTAGESTVLAVTPYSLRTGILNDLCIGIDGTTYSTAGDAVRGQVEDVYDLINVYATDQNISTNKKFDFSYGQVYRGGSVVDGQRIAYTYYNDDSVSSIVFDDAVWKVSIFAYNGTPSEDNVVLYTAWITESPAVVPEIGEHTCIGINATKLNNTVLELADVKASISFVSTTPNPFATRDWVSTTAAILNNGKVPIAEIPTTTDISGSTSATDTVVPTEKAVSTQVDNLHNLIDEYTADDSITENKKFDFTLGKVNSGGNIVESTSRAYVFYNDDTVRSITFDAAVYKINIFAYNGTPSADTQVLFTTWFTESPLIVPDIAEHTMIGVMLVRVDGNTISTADVKAKTTFVSVTPNPLAFKDWVLATTAEATATGLNRYLGKKIPYPTGFESRLKPQIYRSAGGRYMIDVASILSANRIVEGTTAPVWVALDGNDSNDGSESSPFATLTKALTTDATTIYVKSGTYTYSTHYARYCNLGGHNVIGIGTVVFDSTSGDFPFSISSSAYVENIVFKGGRYSVSCGLSTTTDTCVFYRCTFRDATDNAALAATGGNYYIIECSAFDNAGDGFNYHKRTVNETVVLPCAVEVDCIAYNCGDGEFHSDNGSTTHDGGSIVRVNGRYWNTHGGVVADIGVDTNTVTYSCNFGVYAGASTNHTTGDEKYDASFWCSVYTKMWLFDCVAEGSRYDISCYTNSVVKSFCLMSPDMFDPSDYKDASSTIIRK